MARYAPWLAVVLLLGGAWGIGCDRPKGQDEAGPATRTSDDATTAAERLPCFVTVYPLADLVRQVGGGRVSVDWYAELGADPEHPDANGKDLNRRLTDARLIVTSGWGDGWAVEQFSEDYRAAHVLRPEHLPPATTRPAGAVWAGGAVDQAWWLDPAIAAAVARAVADRLSDFDVRHAADYRHNADECVLQLEALSAELAERLAPYRRRKFVELHGPLPACWSAFANRFGLEDLAPTPADPRALTDEDVRRIKEVATAGGAKVVVLSADVPLGLVRQIEQRTGLRAVLLDPLGSSAGNGRNTYVKLMRYNVEQLARGLGGVTLEKR